MPSPSSLYDWLDKLPAFAGMYSRARRRQAATIADLVMEEAMNALGSDGVAQARIILDAGKWLAGKLDPQGFGEKSTTERASLNIADMSEGDLEGLVALASGELNMRRQAKPADPALSDHSSPVEIIDKS